MNLKFVTQKGNGKILHLIQSKKHVNLLHLAQKTRKAFYVYDLDGLLKRLSFFKKHTRPAHTHYAMKANSHPLLLKAIQKTGVGVDIVSGGELNLALKAGFDVKKVVFSGVGKSSKEIRQAIDAGIFQFNVESFSELKNIAYQAQILNTQAPVALRINPDVDAKTHPYITTGLKKNKFGIDKTHLPEFITFLKQNKKHLKLQGLAMHIGSQIQSLKPLKSALKQMVALYKHLDTFSLKTLDAGGGLGIDYSQAPGAKELKLIQEYGSFLNKVSQNLKVKILTEPGRIITARFACLIGQVQYIKPSISKNFAILNTGMHHFMRPCLYQAYHRILPLHQRKEGPLQTYDVVGPVCESSDVLGFDRKFRGLKEKDFLAVQDTGAYGMVLAHTYNAHPLPQEIFLSHGQLVT